MAKTKLWYSDPTKIIPLLTGSLVIFGATVNFFIADARQQDKIKDVEETVEQLEDQNKEQDNQIDVTQTQYQLIQQSLGGIQEALKEMKQKR